MPLYEYECEKGHRFEVIQKFSDPLVTVCPTCGSVVHKLMSSPAIQFKGTGWYITDYAKKDGTGAGRTGGSSSGQSHGSGEEKGDSGKGESAKGESGKSESGKGESGKGDAARSDAPAKTEPGSPTGSASKKD